MTNDEISKSGTRGCFVICSAPVKVLQEGASPITITLPGGEKHNILSLDLSWLYYNLLAIVIIRLAHSSMIFIKQFCDG